MEMPDLDKFDMEQFLKDHQDSMRVSHDRIRCTITDPEGGKLFNFEAAPQDVAIKYIPSRLVGSIHIYLSELKHAVKQLAYLAPYCQKKETDGE